MLPNRQGEIFFCSEETHGILECLPPFKGKIISALGGGYNKLYIIQDTIENEGIVSSLHPPEFDEYDTLFSQDLEKVEDPFEYITAFDNKGAFRQIRAGKKHLVVLTESGHLYSWGYGEFGALGLSGPIFSYIPKPIVPLSDKMVVQVACGEYHTLVLTDKGDVYAWGRGFEGQLGIATSEVPTPPEYDLKERKKEDKLRKRAEMLQKEQKGQNHFDESDEEEIHEAMKRTQAAITSKSQVPYYPVQTASTPRFIKAFFNNPIKYIACGAYFSFAINTRGDLYGWGESRVGQLGIGRLLKVDLPVKIDVTAQPLTEEVKENSLIHTKITLKSDGLSTMKRKPEPNSSKKLESQPNTGRGQIEQNEEEVDAGDENPLVTFQSVSAGYGHTLALSDDGVIYSWGLNSKGQLGVGGLKTRYLPCRLRYDQLSNPLPKYKKIGCGYFTSFAIDENGKLYSWGGGSLGHKDDKLQEMPRIVEAYTENRKFTDLFCTMKSSVFFAPMRIISIQPKSGPSSGGTMLTLLGTGFTETQQQRVKFVFKNYEREVECIYNAASEGLHCVTPKFNDIDDEEEIWPLEADIYLALDGVNWVLAEEKFFIYSSNIQIISMNPKYASIQGGLNLTMDLNIDAVTVSKIKIFTIGFQAKQLDFAEDSRKNTSQEQQRAQAGGTPKQVKTRHRNTNSKEAINPLGITVTSADLDKEDWICVRGSYEKGKVTCEIPNVAKLSDKLLYYNVDVSLNGQQFTGLPSSFRFYDLKVERISPDNSPSTGDTLVTIEGQGFLDSEAKKLRFRSKFGERLVDISWLKDKKQYTFFVPPISWLFGGNVPTPEEIEELKNDPPLIEITLNQLEWIPIGYFHYFDPDFDKIAPAPAFDEKLPEEERKARWHREEAEVDPFAACKNDKEKENKQKELNKIAEQEEKEIAEGFKKPGAPLYLRGKNFIKSDHLSARFVYENSGVVTPVVYKNPTKIGVIVPEMEDLPQGINEVQVELSYNGQKYSAGKVPKKVKVLCFGKDMTPEQRQAFENEELKKKKGAKK